LAAVALDRILLVAFTEKSGTSKDKDSTSFTFFTADQIDTTGIPARLSCGHQSYSCRHSIYPEFFRPLHSCFQPKTDEKERS
jgi:hypothetical protein